MEHILEEAGLTCNKNAVPFDPLGPVHTSGVRLGTPAGTTRGFGPEVFAEIGHMIADLIVTARQQGDVAQQQSRVRARVFELCQSHPIYQQS
jgi:glycine hydroxymethyltransferase